MDERKKYWPNREEFLTMLSSMEARFPRMTPRKQARISKAILAARKALSFVKEDTDNELESS